jgi:FixJ family two-component response regulator
LVTMADTVYAVEQMPTIFITGQDRPGMEERSMRLGASSYLRKPVDEESLLGAIRLAMNSLSNNRKDENRTDDMAITVMKP